MTQKIQYLLEYLHRQKLYFLSNIQHSKRIAYSKRNKSDYLVFVDGSYRNGIGVGYGAVIVQNGKVIQQIAGNFSDVPLALQSLGEFTAVIKAIEWCENQGTANILVHYDCEGIRHLACRWSPKRSKAKQQSAYRDYHKFMQARLTRKGSQVRLIKVKAHSCDMLNNWADRLAKMGLYRLTVAQVRKEGNLPRQTSKGLQRMIHFIESYPLELQYA